MVWYTHSIVKSAEYQIPRDYGSPPHLAGTDKRRGDYFSGEPTGVRTVGVYNTTKYLSWTTRELANSALFLTPFSPTQFVLGVIRGHHRRGAEFRVCIWCSRLFN